MGVAGVMGKMKAMSLNAYAILAATRLPSLALILVSGAGNAAGATGAAWVAFAACVAPCLSCAS